MACTALSASLPPGFTPHRMQGGATLAVAPCYGDPPKRSGPHQGPRVDTSRREARTRIAYPVCNRSGCTNLTRGGASACRDCDGSGAVDLAKATALNLLAIMRLGSLRVAALLFCVIAYNVFPNMR